MPTSMDPNSGSVAGSLVQRIVSVSHGVFLVYEPCCARQWLTGGSQNVARSGCAVHQVAMLIMLSMVKSVIEIVRRLSGMVALGDIS